MNETQVIVLILAPIVGAAQVYTAYRIGVCVGALRERERREALEARVRQQIDAAARSDRELWESEIDA
jgi:hypothetical protein